MKREYYYLPKSDLIKKKKIYKIYQKKLINLEKDMDILTNIDTGNKFDLSLEKNINRKQSKSSTININRATLKNKNIFKIVSNRNNKSIIELLYKDKRKEILNMKSYINKSKKIYYNNDKSRNMINIKNKYINLFKNKKSENIFPLTSRYKIKKSLFQNIFKENKSEINNESSINMNSVLNNKFLEKNQNLSNSSFRINHSNEMKKNDIFSYTKQRFKKIIYKNKNRRLIKEIKSIEKDSEEEQKMIEKDKKNNKIKLSKYDSMIRHVKRPNVKFYEDFEIECKQNASSYQKNLGLFYKDGKSGYYTSHFFTILRKDHYFVHDIIHKMPNYM